MRSLSEALREEEPFALTLAPDDGSAPVVITGSIDRIDRLPSGGIEIVDYKTGRVSSQKGVDESLQLSIYALACRDALGLGTPERVTLYFTESALRLSTTRTDEQLDLARADVRRRSKTGASRSSPRGRDLEWLGGGSARSRGPTRAVDKPGTRPHAVSGAQPRRVPAEWCRSAVSAMANGVAASQTRRTLRGGCDGRRWGNGAGAAR